MKKRNLNTTISAPHIRWIGVFFIVLLISDVKGAYAGGVIYHNLVNHHFATISSGPQSALVIDVPTLGDRAAVEQTVMQTVNRIRIARDTGLQREFSFLERIGYIKHPPHLGVSDVVILRNNGRLVLPPIHTRAYGGGTLTFVPVGWTSSQQTFINQVVQAAYPVLVQLYGAPAWSGTVKIVSEASLPSPLGDRDALSGGIYDVTDNEILFPVYSSSQSVILNLIQMMAHAFHGPTVMDYDAWERGMARAVTIAAAPQVVSTLRQAGFSDTFDISDPLYSSLDLYDMLNQPALGNDRFFPISQENQPIPTSSLGGMLYPRLQMSSSAWLKVYAADPNFFKTFNDNYYYPQYTASLAGNIPDLISLAGQALLADGVTTVDGSSFADWYSRQYVLDTSVTPGNKLYAYSVPIRPQAGNDDYSIGVILVYYQTTGDGVTTPSNEVNLSGTCYPIYWDYQFQNRLYLGAQYEQVSIVNGLGTVAPTFFNNIGGALSNGQMRVAMDFPVNDSFVRVYFAARASGTGDLGSNTANNFWGTIVGADTGTITITANGTTSSPIQVADGAFGGIIPSSSFFGKPTDATLTFTDSNNNKTTRVVTIAFNQYVPILYTSPTITKQSYTFPAGPTMISFPVRPLTTDPAAALLNPTTGKPMFTDSNLLMARWLQTQTGADKYLRSPTMGAITYGLGYWEDFPTQTTVMISGVTAGVEQDVTIGLVHGWNQIGDPYNTSIDVNQLQFQYLSNNQSVDLPTAISNGWVGGGAGLTGIWDYSPSTGYFSASTLQPLHGYWINVTVSEGLVLTYPSPTRAADATRAQITRSTSLGANGWLVSLALNDNAGHTATATLGEEANGSDSYRSALDAVRPPDFGTTSAMSIGFTHQDWGPNSGEYLSDIRSVNQKNTWNISVNVPEPNRSYTLTWNNFADVSRKVNLTLMDTVTGRRIFMRTNSSYTFNPGNTTTRNFQIIADPRYFGALRITDVVAQPSRAAGVINFAFNLSEAAQVNADIRTADGRIIRQLQFGRAAVSGENQLNWNQRDNNDQPVPSGVYLLNITARTSEGDLARAVTPVLVIR